MSRVVEPEAAVLVTGTQGAVAPLERLWHEVQKEPWAHDFFALLRRVEGLASRSPRLGTAKRLGAEALRLGQDPELDFAPAALTALRDRTEGPPRLSVRFFGLFGPMGPLPLHLSEYARDRQRNHGDATLVRFADIFHHRALLLFYRAWAQAQPAAQADRPDDDQFAKWVGALFGQAGAAFRHADAVPDAAKRHVAAHLALPARNAESVVKVLRQYFDVPVSVESHVGHWMGLRSEDRSRLGRQGARLGVTAVAGARVWDRQYKLRLHLGPLTWARYQQFLPGRQALAELRDWMRQLIGFEFHWELRLVLQGAQVPELRIGREAAARHELGRSTWLGRHGAHADRGDLVLRAARLAARAKEAAHG
jgi:type VI secretion system protein ImpH